MGDVKKVISDSAVDAEAVAALRASAAGLEGRTVGVVYGGVSSEDRFYIAGSPRESMSITALREALDRVGVHAVPIDPTEPGLVGKLAGCDVVFPNLHGEYGEDGRLQGLLDYLRLPYVGSGVAASAIGADKDLCKQFMEANGIRSPRFAVASTGAPEPPAGLGFPVMVKPAAGGSSVGMSLARSPEELGDAIEVARKSGAHKVVLEEFVRGRPISVPVLELPGSVRILSPVEVEAPGDFYDAESKLDKDGLGLVSYVDHEGDGEEAGEGARPLRRDVLEDYTGRLWRTLGCRGFARVDFIVDGAGLPWALEINTIPGLSREGNFAVGARTSGLGFDDVIVALLHEALSREPDDVPIPRVGWEDHGDRSA